MRVFPQACVNYLQIRINIFNESGIKKKSLHGNWADQNFGLWVWGLNGFENRSNCVGKWQPSLAEVIMQFMHARMGRRN